MFRLALLNPNTDERHTAAMGAVARSVLPEGCEVTAVSVARGPSSLESAVDAALEAHHIDLVCLAGFMRLLTPWLVRRWEGRLLNIHPALLPAFKGLHTHERALAAGVKTHGATVHFVAPDMDSGTTIIQAEVPVLTDDKPETLAARVLEVEHKIYPQALRLVAEGCGENPVTVLIQQKPPARDRGTTGVTR